jgi:hypothetical protein
MKSFFVNDKMHVTAAMGELRAAAELAGSSLATAFKPC